MVDGEKGGSGEEDRTHGGDDNASMAGGGGNKEKQLDGEGVRVESGDGGR
ncbi:hypothetical protein Csa_002128 [Cucumis sativus]|uniref:Uncharacterized protein n=1 Tax=Cucumis sativus TaxID=3659 RepID=A0A0A0LJJ5_CUCSA|nr:hypothetical protein Csa_002128 [Cucumis sativus]